VGVERLDRALAALHFPFHVLIMRDLPPGDGDPDVRAQFVTDTTAERWATAGLDPAVTSYFALTFEPRKFSLLVGAKWKTDLGLEDAALDPYLGLFLARARGTPSDLAGGIIDMAEAIDAFVFDQVDPARIEARRIETQRDSALRLRDELISLLGADPSFLPWEVDAYQRAREELQALIGADTDAIKNAELQPYETLVGQLRQHVSKAKADEAQRKIRHSNTRHSLSLAISTTRSDLAGPDLPADVSGYRASLLRADKAYESNDVELMSAALTELTLVSKPLHTFVIEAELAAQARARLINRLALGLLLLLLIVGPIVAIRRFKRMSVAKRFAAAAVEWDDKLRNAAGRYVEFYGKREGVLGLTEMTGRTAELLTEVTTKVDAIYTTVRAMEGHVARCKDQMREVGFIAVGAARLVHASLDAPFPFDTGELNEADLFGPETKNITIDPNEAETELDLRFKASLDGWKRLEDAAEKRFISPDYLFPHAGLDALIASADEATLPHRWLADHPLFGDDASDQAIYATAEALRWQDALAYLEHIEALQAIEVRVSARVEELVSARRRALEAREAHGKFDAAEIPADQIVLDSRDDPRVALGAAEASWGGFCGVWASPPTTPEAIAIDGCLGAAMQVVTKFAAVSEKRATVASALQAAKSLVEIEVPAVVGDLKVALAAVTERAAAASLVHAQVGVDSTLTETREALVATTRGTVELAKLFEKKRLVEVLRGAASLRQATTDLQGVIDVVHARIDALDAARDSYLQQLADAEAIRDARAARIQSYGVFANLPEVPRQAINGPVDYTVYLMGLSRVFDRWEAEERSARVAYEAEQRRRREAAEAAERAAAQARARARAAASSFSSSSRSSSSSFGSFSSRSTSSSSSRSSSSSSSSRSGSYGGSSKSSSRSGSW